MSEGKDVPQSSTGLNRGNIGGYPVTSGPLSKENAANTVYFVDISHTKGTLPIEGAAKVGQSTPESIKEFTKEALFHIASRKALAPNRRHIIPPVIDYPSAPDSVGNEQAVLITEKIGKGENLQELIEQIGGIGVRETLRLLFPLALTLDDIKKTGISHRDLKPANILLDNNSKVRLSDFGAAVTTGHRADVIVGTPGYIAPEHRRGDIATDSTNIWGFGAIVFYSMTGRHLMEPETSYNNKYFYSKETYERYIKKRIRGLSPKMQVVMRKAVAFDPGDRYKTCTQFLVELEHVFKDTQQTAHAETIHIAGKHRKNKFPLMRRVQGPKGNHIS